MNARIRKACPTCKGDGSVVIYEDSDSVEREECPKCHGRGWISVREDKDADDPMANNS